MRETNDLRAGNVDSIDAIISAMYSIVSGPAGEKDWKQFNSLFLPNARLVRVTVGPDANPVAQSMDVAGYRADVAEMFRREPFYEIDVCRRTEHFGSIAHVYSTFEARRNPQDPTPFKRGLNTIQLFHDGRRWWIVSVLWQSEGPGVQLPQRYLAGAMG